VGRRSEASQRKRRACTRTGATPPVITEQIEEDGACPSLDHKEFFGVQDAEAFHD
jgi:hypothetical protein